MPATVPSSTATAKNTAARVTAVVKPGNTVLVHDSEGYQPVAWLTRADGVSTTSGPPEELTLVTHKGETTLRLAAHDRDGFGQYPVSTAETPIKRCPDCGGALVRADGVHCVGCGDRYGVPGDAPVRDDRCSCGLPRMRVKRGYAFDVCLDRNCESLDRAVRRAFDREWDCPDCGGDLRLIRRSGLLAGCERYPDCDIGFVVPAGVVDGECPGGLPAFETESGRRCLDLTCERAAAPAVGDD